MERYSHVYSEHYFLKEFKEIEKDLHTLTRMKMNQFAFIAATRAVPFLCTERSFSYWPDSNKQRYLYHIFSALDICACAITATFATTSADANSAADAIYDVHKASNASCAANNATLAIASAVRTVRAAFCDDAALAARDAYVSASKACEAAVANLVLDTDSINEFKRILLSDYNAIKYEQPRLFKSGIDAYGEVLDNFIDDLCEIGCRYWADLYKGLFANKFVLNEEELRWRAGAPNKVKRDGASAIAGHMMTLKSQSVEFVAKETRLILIGSAGAGKTTLARRLNGDLSFPEADDTTYGVDVNIKISFNGVKAHIWDFGGQVMYHSSHRCFLSENCVYILVVNGRDEAARDVMRINYWLDTIRVYSNNNAKVFILANESDYRKQDIDVDALMRGHYGNLIQDVDSFNIGKDLEKVEKYKEKLAEYIEARGHHAISAKDKAAMDDLSVLLEKDSSVIEKRELWDILEMRGIKIESDRVRAANVFNMLGIALSFDCIADYVLNPEWISGGVHRVVDYMKTNGMQYVDKDAFFGIFNDEPEKYPIDKRGHIYELMIQHKIGFENRGNKGLIVPCVASQSKPSDINVQPSSDKIVTKVLRDDSKEFPADFFERFIYANHNDLGKRPHKGDGNNDDEHYTFWLTGMVLTHKGQDASALIEIDDRVITISVWGKEKEKYRDEIYKRLDSHLDEYGFVAFGEESEGVFGEKREDLTVYLRSDRRFEKLFKEEPGGYERFMKRLSDVATLIKILKYTPYVTEGVNELINILFLL